jgi:hypothetical protein
LRPGGLEWETQKRNVGVLQTRRLRILTTRRITGLLMMTGAVLVTSGTTSILATDKGCDSNVYVTVTMVARFRPYIRRPELFRWIVWKQNV